MKKCFIVFVTEKDAKYYAFAETIKTGENLIPFCKRYKAITAHLCETRTQADGLAVAWNRAYRKNGTNLY